MYKKHLFCFYPVFLSVLALVTSCVTGGASASRPVSLDRAIQMAARSIESNVATGQRQKIALLNFNSPSEQFSEYVLEELTGQLVNGKKLIVVDRRELELIRQEENFQMSGEVSDESAQAIGKKLGAQLIVSGSLNAIGKAYRIRIRALNVETAAIEASPSADISAAEEKVMFLLDGKGSILVNTNFRQTTTRTASKNINFVVAGNYYLGSTTATCYWVNGVRTDLSFPNGKSGLVYGIAVSGGKVYALGLWDEAFCYWVDGVRTDLSVNGEIGFAFGIAVSGGTVYVAGFYDKQNNDLTACYWVNGIRTDLPIPNGASGSAAYDIAVSGGKVYVAGSYHQNSDSTACYWVDKVRTDLPFPSGATRGSVEAIAVSGGKVYVAGSYEQNSDSTACYWVNGIRTDLPVPSGAGGSAYDIAVSGGKVYVAGSYRQNSDSTACYWVDGIRTDLDLPVPSGATRSIEAIAIEG
jgi:TolB-like protein